MRISQDRSGEAVLARSVAGRSIPGVGRQTANLLAIELPGLGRLDAKQIASLTGVAPHPVESGKSRGTAYIRGGRPRVRARLYMSAFNARRYNPVIGGFYERLVE